MKEKYIIFDALSSFNIWVSAVNIELGYPNEYGTVTYTTPIVHPLPSDNRVACFVNPRCPVQYLSGYTKYDSQYIYEFFPTNIQTGMDRQLSAVNTYKIDRINNEYDTFNTRLVANHPDTAPLEWAILRSEAYDWIALNNTEKNIVISNMDKKYILLLLGAISGPAEPLARIKVNNWANRVLYRIHKYEHGRGRGGRLRERGVDQLRSTLITPTSSYDEKWNYINGYTIIWPEIG